MTPRPPPNWGILLWHILGRIHLALAAGALGFWMERERIRLRIPDKALENLRELAPSAPRYALGAKPRKGKPAKGWNVILPIDMVEPNFEGMCNVDAF